MKNCPHCGALLPVDARFCYYCMTSLDEKIPAGKPLRRLRLWIGLPALACVLTGGLIAWGILALIGVGAPDTGEASSGAASLTAAAVSSSAASRGAAASRTESRVSSLTALPFESKITSSEQTSRSGPVSSAASSESKASSAAVSSGYNVLPYEWFVSSQSAEVLYSGTTGSCKWELDSDGVLTLSGKGATADYTLHDEAPWSPYYNRVTAIRVKSGVTYVGAYAFRSLTSMTSATLPDTLTAMGTYVFSFSALTSVSLPAGVADIPDSAFYTCSLLASVTLPTGLRTIGDSAFSHCSALEEIVIPEGTVSIGDDAFYYSGLIRATIPASVTSIGDNVFSGQVTVITPPGSYAESYAKAHGLTVKHLS